VPVTVRPKSAVEIRRDALAVAVSKARQGCQACAERYLDLAVANGATPDEVEVARRQMPQYGMRT
jgi:alkylhydroperoxidase/carboxymuconolactone decarboxylase family protein YurZ